MINYAYPQPIPSLLSRSYPDKLKDVLMETLNFNFRTISFENGKKGPKGTIEIGYEADFSTPRIAWTLLGLAPTDNRVIFVGYIHDYLYQYHKQFKITRYQADQILLKLLLLNPAIHKHRAYMCYYALRAGGSKSFKRWG
jgi:hypothetical protein